MRTVLKVEAKGHLFVTEGSEAANRSFGKGKWKIVGTVSEWEKGERVIEKASNNPGTVHHVYRAETSLGNINLQATPVEPLHEVRLDTGEVRFLRFDALTVLPPIVARIEKAIAT